MTRPEDPRPDGQEERNSLLPDTNYRLKENISLVAPVFEKTKGEIGEVWAMVDSVKMPSGAWFTYGGTASYLRMRGNGISPTDLVFKPAQTEGTNRESEERDLRIVMDAKRHIYFYIPPPLNLHAQRDKRT